MDPTRTWFGQVGKGARQIQLSSSTATDATSSLCVLRSGRDSDSMILLILADLDTESSEGFNVPLDERNFQLVAAEERIALQSPNGSIYRCRVQDINPFTSIELLPREDLGRSSPNSVSNLRIFRFLAIRLIAHSHMQFTRIWQVLENYLLLRVNQATCSLPTQHLSQSLLGL